MSITRRLQRPVAIGAAAGLACAVAPMAASNPAAADAAPPPNLVMIMVDDLGWGDISTGLTNRDHPNPFIETPAIARMAQQGTAFDNAYACVNCAPSRAGLLTGQYSQRPDNNIYLVGNTNRGGPDTMLVGPPQGLPDGDDALPVGATTIAETIQGAGYHTSYIGKFHVTHAAEQIVTDHGFDENWGGSHAGSPGPYHAEDGHFSDKVGPELDRYAADYTNAYVDANIAPYSVGVPQSALDALVGTPKHLSDAVADATIDTIHRNKDRPTFTFMAPYAVHSPVNAEQPRSDLLAKYEAKPGEFRASYAALTEGLDQSIGRVLNHLETTADPRNPGHPLSDNTVVIFMSDNGGQVHLGGNNGPLRGTKGEQFEGGMRVPLIAWSGDPELVRPGAVNTSPVDMVDLYPTFARLAGAPLPADTPIDGSDLTGVLRDGDATDRSIYSHLPGYLVDDHRDQRPGSWIHEGRWKLHYHYEDQTWNLYDVDADLGESNDAAASHPDVVAELGLKLMRWLDATDAPLATLREGKDPVLVDVHGRTYANGVITHHVGDRLVVRPGEEVPVVLQD